MATDFEHYFTAQPASDADLREAHVMLGGREVEVVVASGIFSPGGIDRGTAVLLAHVPPPPATGTFLDLGCGWGPIALTLAMQAPDAEIWAVDVNERALDLLRRNAIRFGAERITAVTPGDLAPEVRFAPQVSDASCGACEEICGIVDDEPTCMHTTISRSFAACMTGSQ